MSDAHTAVRPDRWRRRLVWAVPLLVAGAVTGGFALASAGASGAAPQLAVRTPAQLLALVGTHASTTLSGQVSETAAFGLPSLPGDQSSASLSWQTFVTGTHNVRVWADGAQRQRIALIGELSEADVVHSGRDLWTYTSDTNTVTHQVLPLRSGAGHETASAMTPAGAAASALKAVAPTTSVTVGRSRTVAGRSAYTLVIRPRDTRSTVREITVAIDSTRFVPLQVRVYGASAKPAFQTGFTKISFAKPGAATFRFRKPAGATISNNPFSTERGVQSYSPLPSNGASFEPRVIGSGWTSVLELHDGLRVPGELEQLTSTIGSSGGRLLHTSLVNAVLLPDGRVFVGAVQPKVLEHVASTTPN